MMQFEPIAQSGIAAQAFRYMEMAPISSFADDSTQAENARSAYPQALSMMLEAADWSFASFRRNLLQITPPANTVVDPTMPFFYTRPADCLVLREVGDTGTRWESMRDHLCADQPDILRVRYTAHIENEARMPARFRDAVAYQLAVLLSGIYVPTQSKREHLERSLERATLAAAQADARSASPRAWQADLELSDWVREATL